MVLIGIVLSGLEPDEFGDDVEIRVWSNGKISIANYDGGAISRRDAAAVARAINEAAQLTEHFVTLHKTRWASDGSGTYSWLMDMAKQRLKNRAVWSGLSAGLMQAVAMAGFASWLLQFAKPIE